MEKGLGIFERLLGVILSFVAIFFFGSICYEYWVKYSWYQIIGVFFLGVFIATLISICFQVLVRVFFPMILFILDSSKPDKHVRTYMFGSFIGIAAAILCLFVTYLYIGYKVLGG